MCKLGDYSYVPKNILIFSCPWERQRQERGCDERENVAPYVLLPWSVRHRHPRNSAALAPWSDDSNSCVEYSSLPASGESPLPGDTLSQAQTEMWTSSGWLGPLWIGSCRLSKANMVVSDTLTFNARNGGHCCVDRIRNGFKHTINIVDQHFGFVEFPGETELLKRFGQLGKVKKYNWSKGSYDYETIRKTKLTKLIKMKFILASRSERFLYY